MMQLKKCLYNRLPVKKPRGSKKRGKENESTQKGHDDELQLVMKAAKPSLTKVLPLLKDSFQTRRKFIIGLQGKQQTKTILDRYPLMGKYEVVSLQLM